MQPPCCSGNKEGSHDGLFRAQSADGERPRTSLYRCRFALQSNIGKARFISGTHTRAEIKSKCTAGMDYDSDAGGFGCENRSKGTGVYCTVKGKCTGLVPDRPAPQLPRRPTLGGVLKVSR